MKVGVILVGTELLNGGVLDTNSVFIASELNRYGLEIKFKFTVRDIEEEILSALEFCKKNVDLIIVSGGLGPTIDDITKEVIGKFLNLPLVVEEDELKELREKFQRGGFPFIKSNIKEVEKPLGSISFKNDVGMAPSLYIKDIAIFPGVPSELYNMLPKFLDFFAQEKGLSRDKIIIKDIITYGLAESMLDDMVKEFFVEDDIHYEFLVKDYGTLVRLQFMESQKNKVEKIIKKIYNKIGEYIFGEDSERLESKVIELARTKGYKISTAESCTGGMLASKLVDVAGASSVFFEGVVTYDNNSKIDRLGVNPSSLKEYGAVSKEVACEMAKGLKTEICLSTTGIAGPTGDENKPVGLVYMGIKVNNKIHIEERVFRGDRQKIRQRAVNHTLFTLIKILNEDV